MEKTLTDGQFPGDIEQQPRVASALEVHAAQAASNVNWMGVA